MRVGGSQRRYNHVMEAVADGLTNTVAVDDACRRVLTMKFAAGLFDKPFTDKSSNWQIQRPADVALARRATQEGTVLISNRGSGNKGDGPPVLPLSLDDIKSGKLKLAVIGPLADGADVNAG